MAIAPVITPASMWQPTTAYPANSSSGVQSGANIVFWHTTAGGTSGSTAPSGAGPFTDGSITWTLVGSHVSNVYQNPSSANSYMWVNGTGPAGIGGVAAFLGGIPQNDISTNCCQVVGGTVQGTQQSAVWRLEFLTDATYPIIRGFYFGAAQPLRLIVDDRYASFTSFSGGIGGWSWILIDFSTQTVPRTLRKVVLEVSGLFEFAGIDVALTESVYASHPTNSVTLIATGDSICASAGAAVFWDGFAFVLGDLLGCRQVCSQGIGGTGYLINTGGGAPPPAGSGTAITRIADVTRTVAAYPNCIVLDENGLNDIAGFTPAQIQAACVQYLTQLRAAIGPSVPIIKTGIWASNQGGTSWAAGVAAEQALASAVVGMHDSNIFFMPLLQGVGGSLITGTGTSTSPNGTGNSDFYVNGTTLPHPTTSGHVFYANYLASMVRSQMLR
jgi:hypothetical protein